MAIYTGDFLEDVEKRDFNIEFDEKIIEFFDWFPTLTEDEKTTKEAIKKFELVIKFLFQDKKYKVYDDLENYLNEEKSNTFYYVGINQFVIDYYNKNLYLKIFVIIIYF